MLRLEKTLADGCVFSGCLHVQNVESPELVTPGGVVMPRVNESYDHLKLGLVMACGELYADHRGQLLEPKAVAYRNGRMGIDPWPIPVGSLVMFKKGQAWEAPEDRDRCTYVSTSGLVKVWLPGQFKLKKE